MREAFSHLKSALADRYSLERELDELRTKVPR